MGWRQSHRVPVVAARCAGDRLWCSFRFEWLVFLGLTLSARLAGGLAKPPGGRDAYPPMTSFVVTMALISAAFSFSWLGSRRTPVGVDRTGAGSPAASVPSTSGHPLWDRESDLTP